MSEEQQHPQTGHGGSSWTPRKVIVAAALGFVVPVIVILLLSQWMIDTSHPVNPAADSSSAVSARIGPVGQVSVTDPNAPAAELTGEAVFNATCTACHTPGAMGAPKFGDKAAWAPRIREGYQTLIQHAMNGYKAMPAKGGNASLDAIEIARAVAYMANQAGANFTPPAAPAAQPATPAKQVPQPASPAKPAAQPAAMVKPAASQQTVPQQSSAPAAAASPPAKAAADGKAVFAGTCFACHSTGALGAPKLGDKAAWAPRIGEGKAVLYDHALHGFHMMPAHGGNPALTDPQVKAAVDYMVGAAQ